MVPRWGRARPGALGRGPVLHKGPLVAPDIPVTGAQGLFTPKVPFHSACRLIDWRRGDLAGVAPAPHTPSRSIHPAPARVGRPEQQYGSAGEGTLLFPPGHSSAAASGAGAELSCRYAASGLSWEWVWLYTVAGMPISPGWDSPLLDVNNPQAAGGLASLGFVLPGFTLPGFTLPGFAMLGLHPWARPLGRAVEGFGGAQFGEKETMAIH